MQEIALFLGLSSCLMIDCGDGVLSLSCEIIVAVHKMRGGENFGKSVSASSHETRSRLSRVLVCDEGPAKLNRDVALRAL
jgi:hypothetical protein